MTYNNDRRALGMTKTHIAIHNKTGLCFKKGAGFSVRQNEATRFDGEDSAYLAAISATWGADFWTMQVAWGSDAI